MTSRQPRVVLVPGTPPWQRPPPPLQPAAAAEVEAEAGPCLPASQAATEGLAATEAGGSGAAHPGGPPPPRAPSPAPHEAYDPDELRRLQQAFEAGWLQGEASARQALVSEVEARLEGLRAVASEAAREAVREAHLEGLLHTTEARLEGILLQAFGQKPGAA